MKKAIVQAAKDQLTPEENKIKEESNKLSNFVSPGYKFTSYTPKLKTTLRMLPPISKRAQSKKGDLLNA